jgi:hypothetical protein
LNKARAALAGGAVLAFVAGCTVKRPEATKPKPVLPTTVASAAPAIARRAEPAKSLDTQKPATVSEAQLAEFVKGWRKVQSQRDFRGYSALYGEHFSGLIQRGEALSRLDRSAWLHAHEASLTLSPKLASARPRYAIGAGGAQVTFEPRSAAVLDEPLPELFVVGTTDGLKITREAPARSAPVELSSQSGLWLADEHFAILSTAPDPSWTDGEPTFAGNDSALTGVALSRLPKALRAWLGRPIRVLGERGAVCETRLQRFAIRASITPDLPTAEVWEGCADGAEPAAATVAAEIWRLSANGGHTLVAEFSAPCKGALLAVDPDLPQPPIAAPEPAPAELGATALAEFRALPAYAQIQQRFRAEHPADEGAWDDKDARRGVWSLQLPSHAQLVLISVEAGTGCASFSASLSALWEVQPHGVTPALHLLSIPSAIDERRLTPQAIVDFGTGEGPALLLGPDGPYAARSLLGKTRNGYERRLLTSVPFFAGPC